MSFDRQKTEKGVIQIFYAKEKKTKKTTTFLLQVNTKSRIISKVVKVIYDAFTNNDWSMFQMTIQLKYHK